MIDPIENLSDVQISTSKKGANVELVNIPIQKNAYIYKSLQTSSEDGSKQQLQEIRIHDCHPNHNNLYGQ